VWVGSCLMVGVNGSSSRSSSSYASSWVDIGVGDGMVGVGK